jgi:hypothetical protein
MYNKSTATYSGQNIIRETDELEQSVSVEADVMLYSFEQEPSDDDTENLGVARFTNTGSGSSQGYVFVVDPLQHLYGILKLNETNGRRPRELLIQGSPSVAGLGESTRVRGECRQTGEAFELKVWLNGHEAGDATDRRGLHDFNAVGFQTNTNVAGLDFRFDNFVAEQVE